MSTPASQLPTPGASLSDILSAIQNLVRAINNAATQYLNIAGSANFGPVSSATVVKASAGRICEISIISAGTSVGYVYDSANISTTTKPMVVLPNIVGTYKVTFPFSFGILVVPGAAQSVSGSYS